MELDFELIENDADTFTLAVTWDNDDKLIELRGYYTYLVNVNYQSDDYGNMIEESRGINFLTFDFTDINYFVNDQKDKTDTNQLSAMFIAQVQKLATNFLTQNVEYNGL